MALTATPVPADGVVTLSLTGAGVATATITRIDAAGNTVAVRNGDPATITAGNWTGFDYEAPLDAPVTYQATNVSTGAVLATSSAVTLDSLGKFWLGHPGRPELNIAPVVAAISPGTRKARAQVFEVIGRSLPVAQSLRRSSYAGTMTLRARDGEELAGINDLITDGHVLMMRAPASWPGYGSRYIQVGDVDFEQLIRVPDGRFTITLPWTEVARPAGLAETGAGYRWSDLTAAQASWLGVISAYPTWEDVVLATT